MKRLFVILLCLPMLLGARLFDDSAGDYLDSASAIKTATPLSIVGWARSDDDLDDFQIVVAVGQAGATEYFRGRHRPPSDFLRAVAQNW